MLPCLPEEKTEWNFSSVSERQLSHRFLAREHRAELCYGLHILIMGNVPISFSFQVCRTSRTSLGKWHLKCQNTLTLEINILNICIVMYVINMYIY